MLVFIAIILIIYFLNVSLCIKLFVGEKTSYCFKFLNIFGCNWHRPEPLCIGVSINVILFGSDSIGLKK